MSIILVRHGETALNASRVVQPPDTPLSERGLVQAEAAARRIAAMAPSALLASDMPRALQTAEAVARACALPLVTTPLLHERNFGDLRGRSYDSLGGFDPLKVPEAPPGGESEAGFAARCGEIFRLVLRTQAQVGGTLVVVTHGLVIGVLLRDWIRVEAGTAVPERLANASLTIFSAQPPHMAQLVNGTEHLDAALRDGAQPLAGA